MANDLFRKVVSFLTTNTGGLAGALASSAKA